MGKNALVLICAFLIALVAFVDAQAAVFPVTTTADAGPGSLRDAIMLANFAGGNDMIVFAIPPGGPQLIIPLSPLPPLTDPAGVFIDGTTQPGAFCPGVPSGTFLMIEISGVAAGPTPGLWIPSDNNVIMGLIINNFQQDGILIEAPFALTANFNSIRCCFIGTDLPGGADLGNGTNMATLYGGVRIKNSGGGSVATGNTVGSCLISGNFADGVTIWGPILPGDVAFNTVTSNFIGTDKFGMVDLGNDHDGVSLVEGTHDNFVNNNLISGNDFDGVGIQGFNNFPFGAPILTYANRIDFNLIGLTAGGGPLPNTFHGVALGTYGPAFWGCALGNTIGPNNRIAYNGMDGVYVWEDAINVFNGDRNLITQNSIFDNAGLGIDLHANGVTLNDPGDPDVLANEEMNFPIIDSAKISGGVTTVYGFLDTPAPNTATVEVFKARLDPTGFGEGQVYLGSVLPAAGGLWSITFATLVNGDSVTATATDAVNNTSEFTRAALVTCCLKIRGDLNNDGTDANILDLNFAVNRIFRGGPLPVCLREGDVNSDGTSTNILDLNFLVNRIFRGGPPPGIC